MKMKNKNLDPQIESKFGMERALCAGMQRPAARVVQIVDASLRATTAW